MRVHSNVSRESKQEVSLFEEEHNGTTTVCFQAVGEQLRFLSEVAAGSKGLRGLRGGTLTVQRMGL